MSFAFSVGYDSVSSRVVFSILTLDQENRVFKRDDTACALLQ
jgi:hypothetical protein